ncbi:MAG: hypothetical protein HZC06_02435, partial [Methylocystis sp.]|nr:hypothetical protein [Methylocystis sp.]
IRLWPQHHACEAELAELLAALKRNRRACDEVWFSTEPGFPPLAAHERSARLMAAAAEKVKKLDAMIAETQEELALSENSDSSHDIQQARKRNLLLALNQWINELNRLATEQMKIAIMKDGAEAMAAQNRNYQLSEQADNLEKAKRDPSFEDWGVTK